MGLPLADLAEKNRNARTSYKDLQAQPRRLLNSPIWSGLTSDGRAYSAFTYNYERLVPWRTLTGRQQFYQDHQGYIAFGENLPTYKPSPKPADYGDLKYSTAEGQVKALNYLTPHGKWHIHSTYSDNHRMMTLSRGCEPLWINDEDAIDLDIKDNDWVETYNDNGVVCTRAVVSHRIPKGVCIQYHSPERTLSVPKSPMRGQPARRWSQQSDPHSSEAAADDGWLWPVYLSLQLLGADGRQPRHVCAGKKDGES